MNAFAIAGMALLAGFVPLAFVCLRARPIDGLVALQVAGSLTVLIFICLGEAFHRSSYFDLPVIAVAGTWIGGIVFARFLGRFL